MRNCDVGRGGRCGRGWFEQNRTRVGKIGLG